MPAPPRLRDHWPVLPSRAWCLVVSIHPPSERKSSRKSSFRCRQFSEAHPLHIFALFTQLPSRVVRGRATRGAWADGMM